MDYHIYTYNDIFEWMVLCFYQGVQLYAQKNKNLVFSLSGTVELLWALLSGP
jgi:hypothetical protein